jgi:hypothetical protein
MADFGGFNIETPQEVLARVREQRAKALQSDDFVVRQNARIDEAFDALFGNPEANKAERRVKDIASAVSTAMGELPDGASDIDRSRARLRAIQGVVEAQDPAAALQIQQQLLELDSEEFERSRLLASDARAAEQHEMRKREHAQKMQDLERKARWEAIKSGYKAVVVGGMQSPRVVTFRVADEEGNVDEDGLARMQQFLADNAEEAWGPLDPETAFKEVFGQEGMSKRLENDLTQRAMFADEVLRLGSEYLDVLASDPDVFSQASRAAALGDQLVREFESIGANLWEVVNNGTASPEEMEEYQKKLARTNILRTRLGGMRVALAFKMARAEDPGGRLSDQDVIFQMQRLGGENVNPQAIAEAVNDSIGGTVRATVGHLSRANALRFSADISHLSEGLKGFDQRVEALRQINPVPPPPAPQQQSPGAAGFNDRGQFVTEDGIVVGRP